MKSQNSGLSGESDLNVAFMLLANESFCFEGGEVEGERGRRVKVRGGEGKKIGEISNRD